jgi:hypothetical protein
MLTWREREWIMDQLSDGAAVIEFILQHQIDIHHHHHELMQQLSVAEMMGWDSVHLHLVGPDPRTGIREYWLQVTLEVYV